jgi:hypothetical protein
VRNASSPWLALRSDSITCDCGPFTAAERGAFEFRSEDLEIAASTFADDLPRDYAHRRIEPIKLQAWMPIRAGAAPNRFFSQYLKLGETQSTWRRS